MIRQYIVLAALTFSGSVPLAAQFAAAVIDYDPGTGFATDFETGAPYTLESSVVGAPTRVIPGEFGGPVTPFNAPFQREHLISLGAGGTLTVEFDQPVRNDPQHPFGIDFLIFGGTAFIDSDWPNGRIDALGSTFGENIGGTRVYVGDAVGPMYLLNPSLAPVVDGLFPTDSAGDFHLPVDPSLGRTDFAGLDLAGVRQLYGRSGGGTGFDLAWAQDLDGNPVQVDEITRVRVEVLSGRSEIDAFSAVAVPEPSVILLGFLGTSALVCACRQRRG